MKEKALELLNVNADIAIATVGLDNKPKLRVFQIMRISDNTLYFATGSEKEIYQQLKNNPYVEILAMDGNIFVRLAGKAEFNVPDEVRSSIYDDNEILQRLYLNYSDLEYFSVDVDKMEYYNLDTQPPTQETYEL
ncbi:MAG: pyridoxamine 5'-phosphate oxidase family protein [Rikenellaceae bacterium]|nr:pyridoxamine 5'-phosphate oxidase family protein [Rikenellaceae bacterium]